VPWLPLAHATLALTALTPRNLMVVPLDCSTHWAAVMLLSSSHSPPLSNPFRQTLITLIACF
jgi:hypothetical protein